MLGIHTSALDCMMGDITVVSECSSFFLCGTATVFQYKRKGFIFQWEIGGFCFVCAEVGS